MNKLVIIGMVIVALVGGGVWAWRSMNQPKARHIHAGFQVYVDGKKQDFSAATYMSMKPCTAEPSKKSAQEIQEEKAHLHDNIGTVVHSHYEGAVWGDLFKNIHYTIDTSKQVTGYINGKKVPNILAYPINAYDSMVLFLGTSDEKFLKQAVTKQQIQEVEKKSENCGSTEKS